MTGKIIKAFIWSFVLCVVLIIGVLYFLPNMIPEEKIRKEVENVVSRSLGKKVKSGKISFSVLPKIEVYVSDLQIGTGKTATKFTDSHFSVSGVGLLFGSKLSGDYTTTINGNKLSGGIFVDNLGKIGDNGSSNIRLSLKSPMKFYLSGVAKFKNDGLLLNDFIIKTENSDGQLSIDHYGLPKQDNINGKIEFSKINIEEIRNILSLFNKTMKTKEKEKESDNADSLWKDEYLDFSFLRSNINLEVKLHKIVDKKVKVGNLDLDIIGKNNKLMVDVRKSSFFKGAVFGKIDIKDDGQNIIISNNLTFSDLDLGKFLRLYTSLNRIDGFGDLVIKAVTKGHTEKEFISNLKGVIFVQILNGTYIGMDLVELANISNDNIAEIMKKSDKNTDIRAFESKIRIEKGQAEIEKFEVDMPFGQKFSGEGTINLIDYTLDTKIIPAIKVGTVGVSLPVGISGDINNPSYFVNPVSAIVENLDQLEILKTKPAKDIIKGLGQIKDNMVDGVGGLGGTIIDSIVPDSSNDDKTTVEEESEDVTKTKGTESSENNASNAAAELVKSTAENKEEKSDVESTISDKIKAVEPKTNNVTIDTIKSEILN